MRKAFRLTVYTTGPSEARDKHSSIGYLSNLGRSRRQVLAVDAISDWMLNCGPAGTLPCVAKTPKRSQPAWAGSVKMTVG